MASISTSYSRDLVNWTAKDRLSAIVGSNQDAGLSANDPVRFDTSVGNMSLSSYGVTLKANKTYRLKASLVAGFDNDAGYCYCSFYNVTNSAWLVGGRGYIRSATLTSRISNYSDITAEVTPATDIVVQCRIYQVGNLVRIYGTFSSLEVVELDTFAPSRAKWQYEYVSPQLDLTVTGTNWTTTRAKGTFKKTNNGIWQLEFKIGGTVSSASRSSYSATITGVVFSAVQAISAYSNSGGAINAQRVNGSDIEVYHATATSTAYFYSGTVELASKPTGYALPADV